MSDDEVYNFLQLHGVILVDKYCPTCNEPCTLNSQWKFECRKQRVVMKSRKRKDGEKCNFFESLKINTFFEDSHISIRELCDFVVLEIVSNSPRNVYLENEFGWARQTVVDWLSFLREVCLHWTTQNGSEQIGGEGKIVEIDESKFGKRKYNRGRIYEGHWIFGGCERDSKKIFMQIVKDRSQKTLFEVIKEKILPGTTIMSDCWASYKNLNEEGFKHFTVNHSVNFVDPDTKAHTQNIERSWRDAKDTIPHYGRKEDHYPGYLAEFYIRRRFPDHKERIHHVFKAMASLYDPFNPPKPDLQ